MLHLNRKNRGFTLIQLVFVLLFLASAGFATFKIGKPYAEAKIMQGILNRTLQESVKDSNTFTEEDIAKKLFDRAVVQSIPLTIDRITVKRKGIEDFDVHIDLTTSISLWNKASLVIELEANATSEGMPRT